MKEGSAENLESNRKAYGKSLKITIVVKIKEECGEPCLIEPSEIGS
jgi:hypothetical protein